MTDLKDAFGWLAERTPIADDHLAERALARGRRRRRTRMVAFPAVGAAAFSLTIAGFLTVTEQSEQEQVYGSPPPASGTWSVELPREVPKPLPSEPLGPVDMAYRVMCNSDEGHEDGKGPCWQWRLWRADGSSWRVPDVHRDTTNTPHPGITENLLLSPDGTAIAYPRASDQAVVVRDLTTGKSQVVADDGVQRPQGWSRNSRWLVLDPDGAGSSAKSKLVDTETGKVTTLPTNGADLGVPDKGSPVPVHVAAEGDGPVVGSVQLWNQNGSKLSTFNLVDGWDGVISPNGQHLAAAGTGALDVYAVSDGTPQRLIFDQLLGHDVSTDPVLGWYDNHTVLATSENDRSEIRDVYGLDVEAEKAHRIITFVGLTPESTELSLASERLPDTGE